MKRLVLFTIGIVLLAVLAACSGKDGGVPFLLGSQQSQQSQMGGAIQGKELTLQGTTSTVAGLPMIGDVDATGAAAKFFNPTGITTDGTYLYVADNSNNTIRKIGIATGAVVTLAGTGSYGSHNDIGTAASFNSPFDIIRDGANLYVTDQYNYTIRQIDIPTGTVTTLAGSAGYSGYVDGASGARFNAPRGITTDGTNLYVVDSSNHAIRQIVISTGSVTTLAGSGSAGSADGTGTAARFRYPTGITTDGAGNLYVADTSNHTIRKIEISTRLVSTITGSALLPGSADDTGTAARFDTPSGILFDGTGSLYVTDMRNNTIRKIVIGSGVVTTIAGTAGTTGSADGTGASASFFWPRSITRQGTDLYVTDMLNQIIRKIDTSTNAVTTVAGPAGSAGSVNGTSGSARFNNPYGITTDGTNIYVADSSNATIRRMVISSGTVTTLAGSAGTTGFGDGVASDALFNNPQGITTDGTHVYVADTANHTIRQIVISDGTVTTLTGSAGLTGSADGTGTDALFNSPTGITTDGTNLYVADTNNHTIRQIAIETGIVSTITGSAGTPGSADGTGADALFNGPSGITTDGTNLYVVDAGNYTIRQIVISTGTVTTLAGKVGWNGSADGTGEAARFYGPRGITTDGTNLYVADQWYETIRKIVISTGEVTTLAGRVDFAGSKDGTGTGARFFSPYGITTDGRSIYVSDMRNNTIRMIE